MRIGILDCGGANLNSIHYSLTRLGVDSLISTDKNELDLTDGLILPGVGSAGNVMKNLKDKDLISYIKNTNKQVLGICIGMQILAEEGFEIEKSKGLGFIPGSVMKLNDLGCKKTIPHIGWNNVEIAQKNGLDVFHEDGKHLNEMGNKIYGEELGKKLLEILN